VLSMIIGIERQVRQKSAGMRTHTLVGTGAPIPVLAVAATVLHLVAVGPFARLGRFLPSPDRRRIVTVRYDDGSGVLRSILATATAMGFEAAVLGTEVQRDGARQQVRASMRFSGRPPLQHLVPALDDLDGVTGVRLRSDED
jgi:putative Mg2+ transporter-C (MgtC) family protein